MLQHHLNYWQHKLEQKTYQGIDNITNILDKSKDYLNNCWQNITDIANTQPRVIGTATSGYVSDIVSQHPSILKILQILNWAIIHPIISFILLLLFIAFLWSIIKGIVRLIETVSWSIFKVPLKLLQVIITGGFTRLFQLFKNKTVQQKPGEENNNQLGLDLTQINVPDKHKRLIEINHRLELIHQEQQELLKEAANIINSNKQNSI